jgi:hypothetical protein
VAWRFRTSTDHTAACLRKVVNKLVLAVLLSYYVISGPSDAGICPGSRLQSVSLTRMGWAMANIRGKL